MWIDTHCHLDAPEFDPDRDAVRQQARQAGVRLCVLPAVQRRLAIERVEADTAEAPILRLRYADPAFTRMR